MPHGHSDGGVEVRSNTSVKNEGVIAIREAQAAERRKDWRTAHASYTTGIGKLLQATKQEPRATVRQQWRTRIVQYMEAAERAKAQLPAAAKPAPAAPAGDRTSAGRRSAGGRGHSASMPSIAAAGHFGQQPADPMRTLAGGSHMRDDMVVVQVSRRLMLVVLCWSCWWCCCARCRCSWRCCSWRCCS